MEVFDEDKTPMDPDDSLGKFEITVRELFREPNDGECEVELVMNGENTGCYVTLSAELFHLSEELQSFPDGVRSENYEGKNELCGLATIIITKGKVVASLPLFVCVTYTYVHLSHFIMLLPLL